MAIGSVVQSEPGRCNTPAEPCKLLLDMLRLVEVRPCQHAVERLEPTVGIGIDIGKGKSMGVGIGMRVSLG